MLASLTQKLLSTPERQKRLGNGILDALRAQRTARALGDQARAQLGRVRAEHPSVQSVLAGVRELVEVPERRRDVQKTVAQQLRLGWELACAEAELREALEIYSAHEHRYTAYRARAVVVLKFLEFRALRSLATLPWGRVEELQELALQIRQSSLSTGSHTRGDRQCGQCVRQANPDFKGGDCCSGMVFLGWDELDATFRVLCGERAPVVRTFEDPDWTRCGLLGPTGCRLTPGTRPTVCTSFYCGSYQQDLRTDGRWQALSEVLQQLNKDRRALGFRINLNKRFRGQGQDAGPTLDSHPLDFVWDRLRDRGAQRTAAGNDGKTPGNDKLKVLDGKTPGNDKLKVLS